MKKPIFTGSGVAIVTPFTKDGVDFDTLGKLLDFQLEHGTDAIVACGTTGEASTMTPRERTEVISFCADHVKGRVPVIAGSGSNSTSVAVSLSQEAEKAGADGLLLVTPYYNKASQTGLIQHYRTIADAVNVPCILYNVPSRTGVPICALGGVGVISVAANVLPAEMHTLARLCLDNDFAEAGKLQLYLKDFCDAMFCEVNPIPVKTALNLLGWEMGDLRLPLCPPSDANLARIRETLVKYTLLPAE